MKKIFYEDRIDIYPLINIITEYKINILKFTLISGVLFFVSSFFFPSKFDSVAILAPANNTSNPSSSSSSGLADIAESVGVSIDGNDEISQADLAIALVSSRSFFGLITEDLFFDKRLKKLPDEKKRNYLVNPNEFEKTYNRYLKSINVRKDDDNGLYTISLSNRDPVFAQEFLTHVINLLNKTIKDKEVKKANEGRYFLEESLADVNINEIRQIFSALLVSQVRTVMLAEASKEFVFEVVDPPYVPVKRSFPKRFLFLLLGLLIGFITSYFYFLISEESE